MNNWNRHYLVKRLRQLNPNESGDWQQMAQEINEEVRQPMLFTMSNKGMREYSVWHPPNSHQITDSSRTLVTGEWILKITNYNVHLARIADSQLVIVRSSSLQQVFS
jgi:hypothetical protein